MARTKQESAQKVGGRLAKLADIGAQKTTLLNDIQAHLIKKAGVPEDRDQTVLHPSEMAKAEWCPRQSYYRIAGFEGDKKRERAYSFQTHNVFQEGHAIHAKWQGWLQEMDRLWGKWVCPNCAGSWFGTATPSTMDDTPHKPGCSGKYKPIYKEVPLKAPEYLIAGHADGAVLDKNALIEIKSVGIGTLRFEDPDLLDQYTLEVDGKKVVDFNSLWASIKRPFSSHLRQGNIYLRLCLEMGLPYDKMVFIYESKVNQAVKEFTVKHNPAITDRIFAKALDVKRGIEVGLAPERPSWAEGKNGPICKSCPFAEICWGDDEASTKVNEGIETVDGPRGRSLGSRFRTAA